MDLTNEGSLSRATRNGLPVIALEAFQSGSALGVGVALASARFKVPGTAVVASRNSLAGGRVTWRRARLAITRSALVFVRRLRAATRLFEAMIGGYVAPCADKFVPDPHKRKIP